MPRYLFTFTRLRTIEDVLEIPIQAWSVHEAKQKLTELQDSDDYDQSLYIVSEDNPIEDWWNAVEQFTQDGEPQILNDE